MIPCVFNKLTGFYCPGCGATRALYALLNADIYQAFRYNMFFVIILPFLLGYLVYKKVIKGDKKIPNSIWYFLVICALCFGILRNIPFFNFLAPTDI